MIAADPNMIISMADFRRVFCVTGTVDRVAESGLDFRRFVREGLPLADLLGKGFDPLVERVVEAKLDAEAVAVTVIPAEDPPHGR